MKKKLIALLICAAVCLTTGCGSKSSTSSTNASSSTPSANEKFARGKWNGDVFTSDFFGIKITLDSSCVKGSDEELALINGIPDMSDANFNSAVEKSGLNNGVYEMYVEYRGSGSLSLAYNRYEGVALDEYVQLNANGLRMSEDFQDVVIDKIEIGGESHPCVYATFVLDDVKYNELMVMYQKGDYFAILTIGAQTDYDFQNMCRNMLG